MFSSYAAAVVAALTTGETGPLVGGRIRNYADGESEYPYIWLTDEDEDWSEKTGNGIQVLLEVHIGSRYGGNNELNAIKDAVYNDLHNASLVLNGASLVLCQHTGSTRLQDPDAITRHAVVKFNLLITED